MRDEMIAFSVKPKFTKCVFLVHDPKVVFDLGK